MRDGHCCTNSWEKCGAKTPPIINPIDAFGTGSGLHSLGVSSVRANVLESRAHLAKRVCRRGIRGEKTGGDPGESEKTARACIYIKIDQYSRSPQGIIGGSSVSEHSPFFPSLILNSYTHLLSLGMSGGHIFSNAHGTAMNGGTFYAADTVSE